MSVHRGISNLPVVGRCFDEIDCAPFGHFGRDVAPMSAVVGADVDQTIVASRPKCSLADWRLCQRKNRVVVFDRGYIFGQGPATRLLFRFVVAREVVADFAPALAMMA